MFKTLYVNGCSWTAGDELNFDTKLTNYVTSIGYGIADNKCDFTDENGIIKGHLSEFYNKFNWGFHLSQLLNVNDYINDAVGGGSNERILRTTIEFLMNCSEEYKKSLLVVIGWTSSDRREVFINKTRTYEKLQGGFEFSKTISEPSKISNNLMKEYDTYHSLYYEHMYSYFDSVMKYSQQIYSMVNLLENLKIKYIFFNSIETFADIDGVGDSTHLKNFFEWRYNNKNIISYPDMQEFVRHYGYDLGPLMHPLTEGHEAWGDFIYNHIKNNNILQ